MKYPQQEQPNEAYSHPTIAGALQIIFDDVDFLCRHYHTKRLGMAMIVPLLYIREAAVL